MISAGVLMKKLGPGKESFERVKGNDFQNSHKDEIKSTHCIPLKKSHCTPKYIFYLLIIHQ